MAGFPSYETAARARKVLSEADADLREALVAETVTINGAYQLMREHAKANSAREGAATPKGTTPDGDAQVGARSAEDGTSGTDLGTSSGDVASTTAAPRVEGHARDVSPAKTTDPGEDAGGLWNTDVDEGDASAALAGDTGGREDDEDAEEESDDVWEALDEAAVTMLGRFRRATGADHRRAVEWYDAYLERLGDELRAAAPDEGEAEDEDWATLFPD